MAIEAIRIGAEGDKVIIAIKGRPALEIPWQHADQLWRAIRQKTIHAREHAQAAIIVADQATLLAAGVPVGLTGNPVLQREARKEAAHLLRPGFLNTKRTVEGIPSAAVVAQPTITVRPPRQGGSDAPG